MRVVESGDGVPAALIERFPRCVAAVDLSAVAANVAALRRVVGPECRLVGVVKANAYGHGAVPVAITALRAGVAALAVACVDEGLQLRAAGIGAPILLLGATPPQEMARVVAGGLTPTVCDRVAAEALQAAAAAAGRPAHGLHVKVDSGLRRFGVPVEEAVGLVSWLAAQPRLRVQALYTHFSSAEEADERSTREEYGRFAAVVAALAERGIRPRLHAANSAATLRFSDLRLDMVRVGGALYGLAEGGETIAQRPALALHGRVSRRLRLADGDSVGYGRTYVARGERRAALVGIGYGDGLDRGLGNRGAVLIDGRRAPIIGRVSMDQIVVDTSEHAAVAVGAPATLLGQQYDAEISAAELAGWSETIAYEVTTGLTPRLPRAYLREGRLIGVSDLAGHRTLAAGEELHRWETADALATAP